MKYESQKRWKVSLEQLLPACPSGTSTTHYASKTHSRHSCLWSAWHPPSLFHFTTTMEQRPMIDSSVWNVHIRNKNPLQGTYGFHFNNLRDTHLDFTKASSTLTFLVETRGCAHYIVSHTSTYAKIPRVSITCALASPRKLSFETHHGQATRPTDLFPSWPGNGKAPIFLICTIWDTKFMKSIHCNPPAHKGGIWPPGWSQSYKATADTSPLNLPITMSQLVCSI